MISRRPTPSRRSFEPLDLLTVLMLLATILLGVVFLAVFLAPGLVPAGLRMQPLPEAAQLPTPTATSVIPTLPPQWTATATASPRPTLTPTLNPTATPLSSDTPGPTLTPGPTGPTPAPTRSPLPFTLQGDAPVPLSNFLNPDGCNWMGIAGLVFDLNGKPVKDLIVHLEGGGLSSDSFTGSAPAYGESGYEFTLSNHPVETTGVYRVQLMSAQGAPLSDVVLVDTFADCSKNLLLVNFVQNH